MPPFICFLNWTDEGAKNAEGISERHDAAHSLAAILVAYIYEEQGERQFFRAAATFGMWSASDQEWKQDRQEDYDGW